MQLAWQDDGRDCPVLPGPTQSLAVRGVEDARTPPFSDSPAWRNPYAPGSECGHSFYLELAAEEKILCYVDRWHHNSSLEGNHLHSGKCLFTRASGRGEGMGTWGA